MPRAVLLQCPICHSSTAFAGTKSDQSSEELQTRAKAHVSSHHIDESKAAIRKHQIVAEAAAVTVSAVDFDQLPTAEWQRPTETWLPDDVTSAEATDGSRPASPGERFSIRSNV